MLQLDESNPVGGELPAPAVVVPPAWKGTKEGRHAFRGGNADLRSSQQGELWAMRQMGATPEQLRAERQGNRTERDAFRTGFNGYGTEGFVAPSQMTAQVADWDKKQGVTDLLNQAADFRTQHNMAPIYNQDSRTQTGFGINHLLKPLYAQANPGTTYDGQKVFGSLLDRAQTQAGQSLAADAIARNGNLNSIKPVKGQEGVFRVNRNYGGGNDIHRISDYYTQNADGTYTPTSYDRFKYDAPSKKSGLGTALGVIGTAAFGMPMLGIPGLATGAIGATANSIGSLASTAAGQVK